MKQGQWAQILHLKCNCFSSELEEVEGLPNCTRCKACRGWFALRVSALGDMEKIIAAFPVKPDANND